MKRQARDDPNDDERQRRRMREEAVVVIADDQSRNSAGSSAVARLNNDNGSNSNTTSNSNVVDASGRASLPVAAAAGGMDHHQATSAGVASNNNNGNAVTYPNPKNFAERLMTLLETGLEVESVSWTPDGQAVALNPRVIRNGPLLKTYFLGNKYTAFLRNFNRWGFRRVAAAGIPDGSVAYRNPLFRRDKPHLVKHMKTDSDVQDVYEQQQQQQQQLEQLQHQQPGGSPPAVPPAAAAVASSSSATATTSSTGGMRSSLSSGMSLLASSVGSNGTMHQLVNASHQASAGVVAAPAQQPPLPPPRPPDASPALALFQQFQNSLQQPRQQPNAVGSSAIAASAVDGNHAPDAIGSCNNHGNSSNANVVVGNNSNGVVNPLQVPSQQEPLQGQNPLLNNPLSNPLLLVLQQQQQNQMNGQQPDINQVPAQPMAAALLAFLQSLQNNTAQQQQGAGNVGNQPGSLNASGNAIQNPQGAEGAGGGGGGGQGPGPLVGGGPMLGSAGLPVRIPLETNGDSNPPTSGGMISSVQLQALRGIRNNSNGNKNNNIGTNNNGLGSETSNSTSTLSQSSFNDNPESRRERSLRALLEAAQSFALQPAPDPPTQGSQAIRTTIQLLAVLCQLELQSNSMG